jgi:hypothetical protein
MTRAAIVASAGLLLAGCGGGSGEPTCNSACRDAKVWDQRIAEQAAWIAEYQEEGNHITATLDLQAKILTEAQQRAQDLLVIDYDTCEGKTFGNGAYDLAALKSCYAQLLANGFGRM